LALMSRVVASVFCIVSNYGTPPRLNEGYRNPKSQPRPVNNWANAHHVRGYAADLNTQNGPAGLAEWSTPRRAQPRESAGVTGDWRHAGGRWLDLA
jgi:hypothetical protein